MARSGPRKKTGRLRRSDTMKLNIAYNNPNTYVVILVDAVLLFLAYLFSYWLKFETISPTPEVYLFFWQSVIPVIVLKLVVFAFYGLQAGMWRYTSVTDFLNIVKATLVSFAMIMVVVLFYFYANITGIVSRSVFIIDAILTITLISSFRLGIRLYYSRGLSARALLSAFKPSGVRRRLGGIPAVIYGANERGELLLRSLTEHRDHAHYEPLGFIDDNQIYAGSQIHGYPVFGPLPKLDEITARFGVRELLVASRLSGGDLERINDFCRGLNVVCRVVPAYLDSEHLAAIDASQLRDIMIEDLLNRDPVTIDYSAMEQALKGACVMVTGAGGSIGSQLAAQIAEFGPKTLVLVDKSENYLYELEIGMGRFAGSPIRFDYQCADVTDERRMDRLMVATRPRYVFHAAAHKHVPLMEANKEEAIRNNIGGIKVMATLAQKHGVERFILISTDKAVRPSNAMGATKRICELYIKSLAGRGGTLFMAVRFGNVLASNGSVIPLFMRQIENRGPVTVTDPDVERFFMTIPEAVLLILQAGATGSQGDLYVLDMGEPVRILDLARKMITLAGFQPDKDIDIVFTGLRPGEKLTEALTGEGESMEPAGHPKINRVVNRRNVWEGVEQLVDTALQQCADDPEKTFRDILGWLERNGEESEGQGARVVPLAARARSAK